MAAGGWCANKQMDPSKQDPSRHIGQPRAHGMALMSSPVSFSQGIFLCTSSPDPLSSTRSHSLLGQGKLTSPTILEQSFYPMYPAATLTPFPTLRQQTMCPLPASCSMHVRGCWNLCLPTWDLAHAVLGWDARSWTHYHSLFFTIFSIEQTRCAHWGYARSWQLCPGLYVMSGDIMPSITDGLSAELSPWCFVLHGHPLALCASHLVMLTSLELASGTMAHTFWE